MKVRSHAMAKAHLAASHRRRKRLGRSSRVSTPTTKLEEEDRKKLIELTVDLKDKEKKKLFKLLQYAEKGDILSGPYTREDRPNQKQYNVVDKLGNDFVASIGKQKFVNILVDQGYWTKFGGMLKAATSQQAKTPQGHAAQAAKEFIEAKLDASQPIQYAITAQASFDQVLYYRLGKMTYDKILKIRELFQDDKTVRSFEFAEGVKGGEQLAKTIKSADTILAAFDSALDYLVGGRESAGKLMQKDKELKLKGEEMKLRWATEEVLRRKIEELEWNVGYWQRYGRLAVSIMPADMAGEFWHRMEVITQLEWNARAAEVGNALLAAAAAKQTPATEPKKEEMPTEPKKEETTTSE